MNIAGSKAGPAYVVSISDTPHELVPRNAAHANQRLVPLPTQKRFTQPAAL